MHPNDDTPNHVFALPVELYRHIISFFDVRDILALRMTCKLFFALTQDRGLWSMMFTRMRATQALPCSKTEFTVMSPSRAERVLFGASKVELSFLQLRERIAHHIPAIELPYSSMNASTCSWRVLAFVSDRFILSVGNIAVILWDMDKLASSSSAIVPWAHFPLSDFLQYVECGSTLYLAVSRVHADQQNAVIYSVSLPPSGATENHRGRLRWEAEFPLQETEVLKHMDPHTGRALFHSPPTSVHIVDWHHDNRRSTISIQADDLDQAWNGVTTLRFCGPYILCFRVRAVEAYPIPTTVRNANPLPLRHRFGPVCFRAVSLSHVRASSDGRVYTVFMLANDVYQGMFHYCIRVTTAPAPGIAVDVLAKGTVRPPGPLPVVWGTDVRHTLEDVVRRMFVSTWSLGSAGLRGVWVDRGRGSIDRRVVAFTTHPGRLRGKRANAVSKVDSAWDRDAEDAAPTMDGKVVHVISSFDLRDDITICAVSEWTGRIAIGSRVGAISLL